MDSFEFNKIAGAVLGTALGVMGLSIVSEAIFAPAEAEHPPMEIAIADTTGGETTTTAAGAAEVVPIAVRLASANVDAGETSAKKCAACHSFAEGQKAKAGPNLWGVVGGPAAHMEGFKYSKAMLDKRAEGLIWTFENLDHYLFAPRGFVPGTAMGFAGLKRDDERANVIAYLRTLSSSPVPLPEVTAEAPAAAPVDAPTPVPADSPATPPAVPPAPEHPPSP